MHPLPAITRGTSAQRSRTADADTAQLCPDHQSTLQIACQHYTETEVQSESRNHESSHMVLCNLIGCFKIQPNLQYTAIVTIFYHSRDFFTLIGYSQTSVFVMLTNRFAKYTIKDSEQDRVCYYCDINYYCATEPGNNAAI